MLSIPAVLALLGVLALQVTPAPAAASTGQASLFQDDDLLIYNTPAGTARTLDTLAALGVKSVRVSVVWRLVAPDPLSRTRRASFNATDPGAYPAGSWARYDQVILGAKARGIGVNLDITAPGPLWATGTPDRADIAPTFQPSAAEFGQFVRAVGVRYSGTYASPGPQPGLLRLGAPLPAGGKTPASTPAPLPRIDNWSIWNEPNQPGWLTPQWAPDAHGRLVEAAPAIYRGLVDAAYGALRRTGHARDTILIGETAPKGLNLRGETRAITPLRFIRALYCLDGQMRPLRGAAAAAVHCPVNARLSAGFPLAHPALFQATGFAHHPYELTYAPTTRPADPDYVTIADLDRLGSALDRAQQAYHRSRRLPYYLTEFGYMSNPPSRAGVALGLQAAFLNQAEFIAYSNPRVRDLAQFLLVDALPVACQHCSNPGGFSSTFETGLEFRSGTPKPSFAAYRVPVFLPVPVVRRGGLLRVWGLVRPAPSGAAARVSIELSSGRAGAFQPIALATTRANPAYLDVRVRLPRSGALRLTWRSPTGALFHSRSVGVVVR